MEGQTSFKGCSGRSSSPSLPWMLQHQLQLCPLVVGMANRIFCETCMMLYLVDGKEIVSRLEMEGSSYAPEWLDANRDLKHLPMNLKVVHNRLDYEE